MTQFDVCSRCSAGVLIAEGTCLRCGAGLPVPATDPIEMHPQCALGEVSFGPRWTVRAPEAAGLPFRLESDGIAIALDVAYAAELHVQLGAALSANSALRAAQVRA